MSHPTNESTKAPSFSLILAIAGVVLMMLLSALQAHTQESEGRRIVTHVAPAYPEMARRMHVSGAVRLEATVSPDGHVEKVKATAGPPLLCGAAREALMHWKFVSAPTESVVAVQINFSDLEK